MVSTYNETYSVEITRDSETGKMVREVWRDDEGQPHRMDDLPARIEYNVETEEPEILEYCIHGVQHRESGPSYMEIHVPTGVVTLEHWKRRGLFREDCISALDRDRFTGEIIGARTFRDQKRVHVWTSPDSVDSVPPAHDRQP